MKHVSVLIIVVGGLLASSCQKDMECFVTAQSLDFSLVDPSGAFILTEADTNTVQVTYLDADDLSVTVPDVRVEETVIQDQYKITSIEMVNLAHQSPDLVFTLTFRDQVLGEVTLDTYEENTVCDPWYVTSALRFNGEPAEQNAIETYLIEVNP
uniref:Uncharacterized protein n=1 Tax=Roseihalotalea indica TaxID=2867963 RepID=A0AA49JF69_9BACT|nr:hypothetical protein K4G66_05510 [Tunicatimonas sp. TK19036]